MLREAPLLAATEPFVFLTACDAGTPQTVATSHMCSRAPLAAAGPPEGEAGYRWPGAPR
jgi:hypothetical protein